MGAESPEKRSKLWFDGRDSALFDVVTGDLVPERSAFTFTQTVVSARPIPAGEYRANYNYLLLPFIPCDHVFTYENDDDRDGARGHCSRGVLRSGGDWRGGGRRRLAWCFEAGVVCH